MCTLTPTFVLEVFKSEFIGKMVNVVFFWIFHNNSFGNRNPHYSKHLNRISSKSTFSMKIELLEIRPRDTEYDCAFFHKLEKIAIKYLLSSLKQQLNHDFKILLICSFVFSAAQTKFNRIKPRKMVKNKCCTLHFYIHIFTFSLNLNCPIVF